MNLDQVSLDDKCERADSEVFLTSTQALVKIATLQGICERQTELLDSWQSAVSGCSRLIKPTATPAATR